MAALKSYHAIAELDAETMNWLAASSHIHQNQKEVELNYAQFVEVIQRLQQTSNGVIKDKGSTFSESSNQMETIQHFLTAPPKVTKPRSSRISKKRRKKSVDRKGKIIQRIFNRVASKQNGRDTVSSCSQKDFESDGIVSAEHAQSISVSALKSPVTDSPRDPDYSTEHNSPCKETKSSPSKKSAMENNDRESKNSDVGALQEHRTVNLQNSPRTTFPNSPSQKCSVSPGSKLLEKRYIKISLERLKLGDLENVSCSAPDNITACNFSVETSVFTEEKNVSSPSQEKEPIQVGKSKNVFETITSPPAVEQNRGDRPSPESKKQSNQLSVSSVKDTVRNENVFSGANDLTHTEENGSVNCSHDEVSDVEYSSAASENKESDRNANKATIPSPRKPVEKIPPPKRKNPVSSLAAKMKKSKVTTETVRTVSTTDTNRKLDDSPVKCTKSSLLPAGFKIPKCNNNKVEETAINSGSDNLDKGISPTKNNESSNLEKKTKEKKRNLPKEREVKETAIYSGSDNFANELSPTKNSESSCLPNSQETSKLQKKTKENSKNLTKEQEFKETANNSGTNNLLHELSPTKNSERKYLCQTQEISNLEKKTKEKKRNLSKEPKIKETAINSASNNLSNELSPTKNSNNSCLLNSQKSSDLEKKMKEKKKINLPKEQEIQEAAVNSGSNERSSTNNSESSCLHNSKKDSVLEKKTKEKNKRDSRTQNAQNQTSFVSNLSDDENPNSSVYESGDYAIDNPSQNKCIKNFSPHNTSLLSKLHKGEFENFSINLKICGENSSAAEKNVRQVVALKNLDFNDFDAEQEENTSLCSSDKETEHFERTVSNESGYEDVLDYEPDVGEQVALDNLISSGKIEAVVQNDDTVFVKIASPEKPSKINYSHLNFSSVLEKGNNVPSTEMIRIKEDFDEKDNDFEEGYEDGEICEEGSPEEGLSVFPESQEVDEFLTSDSNETELRFPRYRRTTEETREPEMPEIPDVPSKNYANQVSDVADTSKNYANHVSDLPDTSKNHFNQISDLPASSKNHANQESDVPAALKNHVNHVEQTQKNKPLLEVLQKELSLGLLNRAVEKFVGGISSLKRMDVLACTVDITLAIFKFSQYRQLKEVVMAVLNRNLFKADEEALNYIIKLSEPQAGLVKEPLMCIFNCAQDNKHLRLYSDSILIILKSMCDQPSINLKMIINILRFHVVIMNYVPPMHYVSIALTRVKEYMYLACSLQELLSNIDVKELAKLDIQLYEDVHEILLSHNKIQEARALEEKLDALRVYNELKKRSSEESFQVKVEKWISNGRWKEIVNYFINGAVIQEDVMVVHNVHCALLANINLLVSNLRMFISCVKEYGQLGTRHIMVVGQMVTAMMLEMHSVKNYTLSYQLLSLLHAFNINYYELQLSVIRHPSYNPRFLMASWALTTPNIVVLMAVETCLEVNIPLAAFNILNSCNWARPLKEIIVTLSAQETVLRRDLLFRLAKTLLVDNNLTEGSHTFKEYLELIENDSRDKDDVSAVASNEALDLFNAYLCALINANDVNTSLDLFEYFHRIFIDVKPSIFRALIILCVENQLHTKAEELYKIACKMGIYNGHSVSPSTLPHRMTVPSHLTQCEMKMRLKDYLKQLFPVLHLCKAEFEKRFSLHITLKEFVPDDHASIALLRDVSPQLQCAFERLKKTLLSETPSLDFDMLPEWVLSVRSGKLYAYFVQSDSGDFSSPVVQKQQDLNPISHSSRFEPMESGPPPRFEPLDSGLPPRFEKMDSGRPPRFEQLDSGSSGFMPQLRPPVMQMPPPPNFGFMQPSTRPPFPNNFLPPNFHMDSQMMNMRPPVPPNHFHNIEHARSPGQANVDMINPNRFHNVNLRPSVQANGEMRSPSKIANAEFSQRETLCPPNISNQTVSRNRDAVPRQPYLMQKPKNSKKKKKMHSRLLNSLLNATDDEDNIRTPKQSPKKQEQNQKQSQANQSVKNSSMKQKRVIRNKILSSTPFKSVQTLQNTLQQARQKMLTQKFKSNNLLTKISPVVQQRRPSISGVNRQRPSSDLLVNIKCKKSNDGMALTRTVLNNGPSTTTAAAATTTSREIPVHVAPSKVKTGPAFDVIVNYITTQVLRQNVPRVDANAHARRLAYGFWNTNVQSNPELLTAVALDRNIRLKLVQYTKELVE